MSLFYWHDIEGDTAWRSGSLGEAVVSVSHREALGKAVAMFATDDSEGTIARLNYFYDSRTPRRTAIVYTKTIVDINGNITRNTQPLQSLVGVRNAFSVLFGTTAGVEVDVTFDHWFSLQPNLKISVMMKHKNIDYSEVDWVKEGF